MEGQVRTFDRAAPANRPDIPINLLSLVTPNGICERSNARPWNPWDSDHGDLNACFEDVTLPFISFCLLLVATPIVLRAASAARSILYQAPSNRLDVVRESLALFCGLLAAAFLVASVSVQSLIIFREQQFFLVLSVAFFLTFFLLQKFACRRGIKQHICLRLCLAVHFVSQVLKLHSSFNRWQEQGKGTLNGLSPSDVETALLTLPEFALFVSFCFFGSRNVLLGSVEPLSEGQQHSSPEARATFWGLLTFSWMYPLIQKGHQQELEASDAYELMPQDTTEAQTEAVLAAWAADQAASRAAAADSPAESRPSGVSAETASTEASETYASLLTPAERERSSSSSSSNRNGSTNENSSNIKLFRVLWKIYGSTCIGSALLKLVYDLLQFVGPVILQRIILFLQECSDTSRESPPLRTGLSYCILLLVANATQTAVLHQYFHRQFRLGMRLRAAVSALIYRKALKIQSGALSAAWEASGSSEGRGSSGGRTTGQYVNLLAVDAQRLQDLMTYVHILWSAPLQICIALFLLFRLLGLAAFGGLAVMLLNGPLTGYIGRQATQMQRRLMEIRDERSTAATELLAGIKAVKMYAWECSFFSRISEIRERELNVLGIYWRLMVASRAQWLSAPICVCIATFGCYVWLHGDLDAATAFTAIALFNILRFPMQLLPMTTNNTLEAKVALSRVQCFLCQKEAQGLPPLADASLERAPLNGTTKTASDQSWSQPEGGLEREDWQNENKQNYEHEDLPAVEVQGASFAWPSGAPLLKDISFRCKKGELVGIVGSTGAGKSGLLLSLLGNTVRVSSRRGASRESRGVRLGEVPPRSNSVALRGTVAYCSQVPWIQSATLKENILFGADLDENWYYQVLEACALLPDISALPGGDETEIGGRGINLSGGQKQRVALARAVYRQADIYLLDDCLSAVDVHVAQHVFGKCLKGLLREKAVLLVSHRLAVLPGCDHILFLSKGTQMCFGKLQDARSIPEFNLFAATTEQSNSDAEGEATGDEVERDGLSNADSSQGVKAQAAERSSTHSASSEVRRAAGALTEEEAVRTGAVPFSVYADYLRAAGGWWRVAFSVLLMFGGSLLLASSNVWLSAWADGRTKTEAVASLAVFAGLGIAHLIVAVLSYLKISAGAVDAARHFHEKLLRSILDAPMSFFDSTPSGRLMNRLTKSIYGIDEALPSALLSYISTFLSCLMIVAVITFVFPSFLVVVLPLLYYYTTIQGFYIPSSRQLQRIEAVSRSPVFSHFQETIEGTETIRAFREEKRFMATSTEKINNNIKIYYMLVAANRWLAVRLEMVGAAVVFSSALFSILGSGYISGGLGGLAVSYALSVTQQLNWLVRMASDRETSIVSVERVQDYSGVEPERLEPVLAPAVTSPEGTVGPVVCWKDRVPDGWPREGVISVKGLCVRYRPDLPLVLKSISFEVKAGERIGLVGRTGAGKSSLLVSLLRLVEPSGGRIEIDGVNIQSVGLRFLRSRFAIIPQDPVLFAGSLRFNIDAQGEHTDSEIWSALEGAHLADAVRAMTTKQRRGSCASSVSSHCSRASSESRGRDASQVEGGLEAAMLPATSAADAIPIEVEADGPNPLDMMVEEGGRNFSVGQRQLICLARALLRRSRILLLDEATAVVDPRTDKLIQETIKTDFRDCTVITIAHRIDTIVDYDRVLVLSEGQVEEFDSPQVLYGKKDSFFRSLCLQAGVHPERAS